MGRFYSDHVRLPRDLDELRQWTPNEFTRRLSDVIGNGLIIGVLDCTYVFCQGPSDFGAYRKTCNKYFNHQSYTKLLNIVAANGRSMLFVGFWAASTSDNDITFDELSRGAEGKAYVEFVHQLKRQHPELTLFMLADRGFNYLEQVLAVLGLSEIVEIVRPPWLSADGTFTAEHIREQHACAPLRAVVEQSHGLWRCDRCWQLDTSAKKLRPTAKKASFMHNARVSMAKVVATYKTPRS
mmetsp:Transcript_11410/g.27731  ORF Transcript_11410/g.27731 Transcript_11410/m.27731 type:complete len:239 (-) Transcript_11410:22-738(-)